MSYDPDHYTVDGRRLVGGFGLAGVALLGLIIVGCPATTAAYPLKEEAFCRHGTLAQAGSIQGVRSVESHLATGRLHAA
jgi:hypothetical protein